MKKTPPVAIVMNMFYTGLGIARSLGEQGIRVIGLSAHSIYGNHTRYADVRTCPDSRENPDQLIEYLMKLGEELGGKSVIYPTRDDDVLFLDRFRERLSPHFTPVIPSAGALDASLDKWETYLAAREAGVPVPRSWKIETREDLSNGIAEMTFPVVLKPLSAHYWRKAGKWDQVGGRKAICVNSAAELQHEYERVAQADPRSIVQEMIPGGDDGLLIEACYVDQAHRFVASFTIQKLAQVPEQFGTGCVLKTVDRTELVAPVARLLESIKFSGIAEVEFKWNASAKEYQLIEINPRPWDQHRLGNACGVDLIHIAYCDLSGQSIPEVQKRRTEYTWVAEDVLIMESLRSLWNGDGRARTLWQLAKGKRIYAIWSAADPLPSLAYVPWRCVGEIVRAVRSRVGSAVSRRFGGSPVLKEPTSGDATQRAGN